VSVKQSDEFGNIVYLCDKELYNLDFSSQASDWVRSNTKNLPSFDVPQMTNPLNIKPNGKGRLVSQSLGFLYNDSNNIMKNPQSVSLLSSAFSAGQGLSITKDNFYKVITLFTSRKTFIGKYWTWINQKDEYMAPNESHPLWEQFQYDSLVYSLFHIHSFQSSLRQINYKDKLWDIKNEFFWMSRDEMMSLAESKYFDDIYRDGKMSDERYVYKLLFKEGIYEKLSPDTKEVLDMASALVVKSFDMRIALHDEKPELHLNTWDAGWYQIKLVLKQFYQDDLREFTKKYKEFEDRMRPLVYELGFLRK
jgi:hypothetical protein